MSGEQISHHDWRAVPVECRHGLIVHWLTSNPEVITPPSADCADCAADAVAYRRSERFLEDALADACHPDCAEVWAPYGRHDPNCQGDLIRDLVAEVRRLKAELTTATRPTAEGTAE